MIETWRDIPGYGGKYQIDREADMRRAMQKIEKKEDGE